MSSIFNKKTVIIGLILIVLLLLMFRGGFLKMKPMENMSDIMPTPLSDIPQTASSQVPQQSNDPIMAETPRVAVGKQRIENAEHFASSEKAGSATDMSCYPHENLTPRDLLPANEATTWAQLNPSGTGSLSAKNFVQSGHFIGINTVGQTMRNANMQLRSDPIIPMVQVSPWLQSTIEADVMRRPFEIGGCNS